MFVGLGLTKVPNKLNKPLAKQPGVFYWIVYMFMQDTMNYVSTITNSTCPAPMENHPCWNVEQSMAQQERKQAMDNINFSAGSDPTKEARRWLLSRLSDARNEKKDVAKKTFFIDADSSPATFAELKNRIEKGLYIWDQKAEEAYKARYSFSHWADFVEWRDPNKPADKAGYEAFRTQLDVAYDNAKDAIMVKHPELGLADLRDFQSAVIN